MEPTQVQMQLEEALGELYEKALVSAGAVSGNDRVTPADFCLVVQLYPMSHLVRGWCREFGPSKLPGSCRAGLAMLCIYAKATKDG